MQTARQHERQEFSELLEQTVSWKLDVASDALTNLDVVEPLYVNFFPSLYKRQMIHCSLLSLSESWTMQRIGTISSLQEPAPFSAMTNDRIR